MTHLQHTVYETPSGLQTSTACGIGVPLSRVNHVDSPTPHVKGDWENYLEVSSRTPKVTCEACKDAELNG